MDEFEAKVIASEWLTTDRKSGTVPHGTNRFQLMTSWPRDREPRNSFAGGPRIGARDGMNRTTVHH